MREKNVLRKDNKVMNNSRPKVKVHQLKEPVKIIVMTFL